MAEDWNAIAAELVTEFSDVVGPNNMTLVAPQPTAYDPISGATTPAADVSYAVTGILPKQNPRMWQDGQLVERRTRTALVAGVPAGVQPTMGWRLVSADGARYQVLGAYELNPDGGTTLLWRLEVER